MKNLPFLFSPEIKKEKKNGYTVSLPLYYSMGTKWRNLDGITVL